ncbi:hypothetical protein MRX96_035387 [Rhipicephalus microplus]
MFFLGPQRRVLVPRALGNLCPSAEHTPPYYKALVALSRELTAMDPDLDPREIAPVRLCEQLVSTRGTLRSPATHVPMARVNDGRSLPGTRPPREGDVPGCACPFGGAPAAAADRRSFPFLDVGRGGPADPGGLGRPGWPWRPPDARRRSVRVYSSFLCLALRLPPAACPARSSPPADDVIGPRSPS